MGVPVPNSTVVGHAVVEGIHGGDTAASAEIPIRGFRLASTQTQYRDGTGGRRAIQPNFSDFRIVKAVDAASPKLLTAHVKGTPIPSVVVTITRLDGAPGTVATYKLIDVLIMEIVRHDAGAHAPDVALEELSLDFAAVEESYRTAGGATFTSGWNVEQNRQL